MSDDEKFFLIDQAAARLERAALMKASLVLRRQGCAAYYNRARARQNAARVDRSGHRFSGSHAASIRFRQAK